MLELNWISGWIGEKIFTEDYGARPSAPKVLVILTDGQDAQPSRVIAAAKELHQKDVIIFAIGVGSETAVDMNMLTKIATEPVVDHIKQASTVEGINTVG